MLFSKTNLFYTGIFVLLATALFSCGQKGPLYLPQEMPQEIPAEIAQELPKEVAAEPVDSQEKKKAGN